MSAEVSNPGSGTRLDRLIFLPVVGALVGAWAVMIAFTLSERTATLEGGQTRLGYTIASLADANVLVEEAAGDSDAQQSELRRAAISKALLQYPSASIWVESQGMVVAGQRATSPADSYINVEERRELEGQSFTVHAALPIEAVLTDWRRGLWIRSGILLAVTIAFLVVTRFLARALYDRATAEQKIAAALQDLGLRDRALESLQQGVTISETSGNCNLIIYTNPAFATLTRHDRSEILGRDAISFLEGELSPEVRAQAAQSAREKGSWIFEAPTKRKDGTTFLDRQTVSLIGGEDGRSTYTVTIHEDVTEARKREQLLLEALQDLGLRDRALESISQGVVIAETVGRATRFIYANPAFADLMRYDRQEIIGRDAMSFLAAEIPADVLARVAREAAEKRHWHYETSMKRKDGTAFLDHQLVSTIAAEEGKPGYSVVIHEDVTEVRKQEQLLLEAMQNLRVQDRALGSITQGVVITDIKNQTGLIIYVNPAFSNMSGYEREEIIGRDTALVYGADNVAEIRARMTKAYMERGSWRIEISMKRKDGTSFIDSMSGSILVGEDGVPTHAVSVHEDVTEVRKREQDLLLRDRALESITQGVVITDHASPDVPAIYTNPAFAQLTGWGRDEIVGRSSFLFSDPKLGEALVGQVEDAFSHHRAWRAEHLLKRKDGTIFLDRMVGTAIYGADNTVTHSVTVHEDVTELRKREELLLEAQKMESVGQLTGGIAHDFNNLLTAIRSNAEDLKEDLKGNELQHMQADIVLQAAERGAGLVAQLMAFARKQELEPKVVDVNALLDSHLRLLRTSLPAHIEVAIRKAPDLPLVYVDPNRLETVILNLVLNARDAMSESSGTITIETMLRIVDADYVAENVEVKEGPYVLIAVTDTGCGMPKNVLERAFAPFFTTKEVGKGTGLGLSMVYGFVKQSGGHAKIYSEEGLGTVVKIYLPAADQGLAAGESGVDSENIASGTGRILLVEDDPLVRQSISGKLIRLGCAVITANAALDAIEILKAEPQFDLVFSDVIMPGPLSGADLVREVRRRWPAVHVLLTSGYAESTVLGKVKLPPDVKLLSKPYSNTELAEAVSEAISGAPCTGNNSTS